MIIKKIILENIRSYEYQEIDFSKGSTILAGDIGAGKTSVLLGIEFALFGLQPGQKGSLLLRNGCDEGKVSLEIEIDSQQVTIERGLKKGKTITQSTANIIFDGKKSELSVTELKNKVLEIINYPKEFAKKTNLLYRFTVYTPQEEMKQIIIENSESRLDTLRHIFGIDKYKRIRENTDLLTVKLREKIRLFEGQIYDLEVLRTKISEKNQFIIDLNLQIIKIKEELEIRKKIQKDAEDSIKEVEDKIREKENYEREIEKSRIMLSSKNEVLSNIHRENAILNKQISELQVTLDSLKVEKLRENLISIKNEIKQIKLKQAASESSLKEVEDKIREKENYEREIEKSKIMILSKKDVLAGIEKEQLSISNQIKIIKNLAFKEEDIEKVVEELKKLEKLLDDKNKLFIEISGKINNLESKNQDFEKLKSQIAHLQLCPTCLQNVPDDYKSNILRNFSQSVEKNQRESSLLENEKISLLKEIESAKNSIRSCKLHHDELRVLKIKFDTIKEKELQIQEIESKKNNCLKDLEMLEKQILVLNEAVFSLKSFEEIFKSLKKEKDELLLIERKKELELSNINNDIDKQLQLKKNIEEKQNRMLDLEKIKSNCLKDLEMLEKQVSILKESVSVLKKYDSIYDIRKKDLENALLSLRSKDLELASKEKEKEMSLTSVKDLEREISAKEIIKSKLLRYSEIEDWLKTNFINIVSITERNIMMKLREEFSKLFNEWFNILVPEIFAVRIDEDFTPIIEQQGFQLDYSYLSGGERTAIALAYRLSLNQVINSLMSKIKTKDLVILDEPTDGFSEQQLDKMRDVLQQLKVEQLIIVSHESKIESFVENIIKFKKNNGVTKII